jgi:hypothetical protein
VSELERKAAGGQGPARGYSWPPFEPGNDAAVKHGAHSKLRLEPRAAELAGELRELLDRQLGPATCEADDPTIALAALALAQVEAATLWLAEHGLVDERGQPRGLLRHLGTMINTASRLCDRLGMTPTSRAALGLDVARTGEALRVHLAERYGDGEDRESGGA